MRRLFFICFFWVGLHSANAADSLEVIRTIPLQARLMSVDELGNVYIVRLNNALIRFTPNGDSSASYRSVRNGDIGSVDPANPLSVLVYYPQYSRIEILDRMLARQSEWDLRRMSTLRVGAVAAGADGHIWVYDRFNAMLLKIDEQLNEAGQSNDLRQEAGIVPSPSFMVEKERKVFLCDTARGVLTFDRYGNYISTIPVYGLEYLQVYGSKLVYRQQDSLISWDMRKVTSAVMVIPHNEDTIINAAIVGNILYVLYAEKLVLYRLKGSD